MEKSLEVVLSFSLLHGVIVKKMDRALSIHGIAFSEFMVMYQISKAPQQTMRRVDLAEAVGMSASGVTRLLNPMQKIKLIEKEVNPRDARVSFVKLSMAGVELLNNAMASVTQSADEMFKRCSTKDVEALLHVAQAIR